MPKFKIVEVVREERIVEAPTAQDALEHYLNNEYDGELNLAVEERHVEDENGEVCEIEED